MDCSKNWCFTINNYTDADLAALAVWDVRYLVFGREVGEESLTPHLQGYAVWKSSKRLSGVKKIHATAHWEIAKGNTQQNYEYCIKQGDYAERGDKPVSKGKAMQDKWNTALDLAKNNQVDEVEAQIQVCHYETLKRIARDHMVAPEPLDKLDNYWIVGEPGCGKSRYARQRWPGAYYKMCNKWWDGYQGEETIIIEDLDLQHKCLSHHLKIWADHGHFLAEVKGGAIAIRPKTIVITTNYSIHEIFSEDGKVDSSLEQALERRFQNMYMSK